MDTRQITILGRLGRDSEVKQYGDNKSLMTFSVGTTCGYGDKQKTIWYKCTSFRGFDMKLAQYLLKGKQVLVMGEHGLDEYTGNDGVPKIIQTINVSYIQLVNDGQQNQGAPQGQNQGATQGQQYGGNSGQQGQAPQSWGGHPNQGQQNQLWGGNQGQQPKAWGGNQSQAPQGGADDDIPF